MWIVGRKRRGDVPRAIPPGTALSRLEEPHQSPPEPAAHHAVDDKVDAGVEDEAEVVETGEDPHHVGEMEATPQPAELVVRARHSARSRGMDNRIHL